MNVTTADLTRYRTLMGTAVTDMMDLPGARLTVSDELWMALTGLSEADWNMALIQCAKPTTLATALGAITEMNCPAMLLLAGEGATLSDQLPRHWEATGELPMMAIDPSRSPHGADPRVRLATTADATALTGLMCEAYGSDPELTGGFIAAALAAPPENRRWWLLEDGGAPVSTVLSSRIAEAVTFWCMATPPQFARRGYGRALLGAVLGWAADDGATLGLLGATPAGEPLYRATGWQSVESWAIYLNAPSVQFP